MSVGLYNFITKSGKPFTKIWDRVSGVDQMKKRGIYYNDTGPNWYQVGNGMAVVFVLVGTDHALDIATDESGVAKLGAGIYYGVAAITGLLIPRFLAMYWCGEYDIEKLREEAALQAQNAVKPIKKSESNIDLNGP